MNDKKSRKEAEEFIKLLQALNVEQQKGLYLMMKGTAILSKKKELFD